MHDKTLDQQEIDIRDYWYLISSSWRLWVCTGVIAAIAAVIWGCCIQSAEYAATASIVASGELPSTSPQTRRLVEALPIDLSGGAGTEAELCRYILETSATRRQVVTQCSLQKHLEVASRQGAAEQLSNRTQTTIENPNIVELRVTLPGSTRLMRLLNKGETTPAAQLTVKVVDTYLTILGERLTQLHLTAAKRKRVFLEEQKEQIRIELGRAEEQLQGWQASHSVMEMSTAGKLATEELVGLQEQQGMTRLQLRAARRHQEGLREQLQQQPEMEPASIVHRANPLVDEIRKKLVNLEAKLAVATEVEGKSRQHPDVRTLQQQIDAATKALSEDQQQAMLKASTTEVANPVVRKLKEELALREASSTALEARIEGLGEAIRQSEQEMAELSGDALEHGRLLREVEIKQTLFETLASEYEQALIEEQAAEPVFHVIDEAVPPERPEGPSPLVQMGLAGVVGVLLTWVWIIASTGVRSDKGSSSAGSV